LGVETCKANLFPLYDLLSEEKKEFFASVAEEVKKTLFSDNSFSSYLNKIKEEEKIAKKIAKKALKDSVIFIFFSLMLF
jgi:hypothetical protein